MISDVPSLQLSNDASQGKYGIRNLVAAITQVAHFIKLKKGAIMLAKIKTLTNLGSVVISAVLVTLQVIDLFKHENNNPAITDGNETDEG